MLITIVITIDPAWYRSGLYIIFVLYDPGGIDRAYILFLFSMILVVSIVLIYQFCLVV